MAYQPIESYGVIGDMRTAALVGTNGSIDWLCFPHFDSPRVFGAILDHEKGGRFSISPTIEEFRTKQLCWPDSNVLVTRFPSETGVAEVTDYMPVGAMASRYGRRCLIRRVTNQYTQLLEDSRRHAFDRMVENAQLMGANGVVAMRFDSYEMGQNLTEIVAYGTAVVIAQAE